MKGMMWCKEAPDAAWMRMVGVYGLLRLRQMLRLLREVGFVRSLLLLLLGVGAFWVLVKADNGWVVSAVAAGGLFYCQNERRDKPFLSLHIRRSALLLRVEYTLLSLPFWVEELYKGRFWCAGLILAAAMLLPGIKAVRWNSVAVPLPFLYKGGLEYIRMFRRYGPICLLLLLAAFSGGLHGNMRVGKAMLILWGIVQAAAYLSVPQRQELALYKDYATFQRHLVQSCLWNVTVTSLPFVGIMLSFSFAWADLLFSVSAIVGAALHLWILGMVRWVVSSSVELAVCLLVVLVPLFFYSCLVPSLLLFLLLMGGAACMIVRNRLVKIWN